MPWLKSICCLLALALTAPAAVPVPSKPVIKLAPIPPVGPSPITPDCRYLFVVDTSAAMQRSAEGLYRATHRLIATGVGGRMQEGDIFTVWTYADTVLTREFPLNAWTRDLNIALANRTYEFLAQQKFRGKSNLRPVFAELGQVLAIATNLTVILVSDGTDVVVGTPFDRAINVLYGKRASEMRAAKMPFLTALVTQRGEFTTWAVRGGLEDIALPFPEPPPLPVPALVLAPAGVTPTPIPIRVIFTPPPPPPPPSPVVPPKLVPPTNPASVVVATLPPPNPPPTVATNIITKPAPPAAPPPAPLVAKAPGVVVPKPTSPPPGPAPVLPASPLVVVKPKETLVTPVIPPVTVPARYQPQSVVAASNALAKVELLRPATATSAPPGQPLVARVIPPQPAPPKATNTAATKQPTLPAAPVPTAKPITNPPRAVPTAPKLAEPKVAAPATNSNTRLPNSVPPLVFPLPKVEARVLTKPPVVAPAPAVAAPKPGAVEAKKFPPAPRPLAVNSAQGTQGGWLYLVAALGLLAVAGCLIAHLLRPRPQPSAISRSLDDQRG